MSKEILNEGVEFIRPPEDIYNYKIPDKTSVNDEPEVSGDFYILFKYGDSWGCMGNRNLCRNFMYCNGLLDMG